MARWFAGALAGAIACSFVMLSTVAWADGAEVFGASANGNVVVAAVSDVIPSAPPVMSKDCHSRLTAGDRFRRPLRGLRRAVRDNRNPRVLAIGSSTTVGTGASKPANTYVAKLENGLEAAFKGVDFDVFGRGVGGEMAEGQSARMKAAVEEIKPDLVLWQVGTNDAIGHVNLESFKNCLRKTLTWLEENKFDVMLVDPQYGDQLTKDAFYEQVVAAISEIALEKHVLLVDRFDAMRSLSREHGDIVYLSADQLHMNDTGHRCMAEQLSRAIVAGVLQADNDAVAEATNKLRAPHDD